MHGGDARQRRRPRARRNPAAWFCEMAAWLPALAVLPQKRCAQLLQACMSLRALDRDASAQPAVSPAFVAPGLRPACKLAENCCPAQSSRHTGRTGKERRRSARPCQKLSFRNARMGCGASAPQTGYGQPPRRAGYPQQASTEFVGRCQRPLLSAGLQCCAAGRSAGLQNHQASTR